MTPDFKNARELTGDQIPEDVTKIEKSYLDRGELRFIGKEVQETEQKVDEVISGVAELEIVLILLINYDKNIDGEEKLKELSNRFHIALNNSTLTQEKRLEYKKDFKEVYGKASGNINLKINDIKNNQD